MNVLSINFNHDGSAAIVRDGIITGYVNTERFSRVKKHPGIREVDLAEVLDQSNLALRDVNLVQLLNLNTIDSPDIPLLHGSDLKETWPDFWLNGSFNQIRLVGETLKCEVLPGHHKYHAALAALFSPFESGVSLAVDPVGAESYFFSPEAPLVRGKQIPMVSTRVYVLASGELFGSGLLGAGKLMGLAPYGKASAVMDYSALAKMGPREAFNRLREAAAREMEIVWENGNALNASLALRAQQFLEHELSVVLHNLREECLERHFDLNLCLSGGTALNSTANERCFSTSGFEKLYLHPACGDDGMAIGAGLWHWHVKLQQPKAKRCNREAMYSCRGYDHLVESALENYSDRLKISEWREHLEIASLLNDGQVIGWFQGPSEIGPRALGNRSILADPRRANMKEYINSKIKCREGFRPFAPSILFGHLNQYFDISESPFMLRIAPVKQANVPGITHVDGTSRPQSVRREDNPNYYDLIASFNQSTGVPLILNTSFNGRGEPIVETPGDAIECMLKTGLDALVFPKFIARRASGNVGL